MFVVENNILSVNRASLTLPIPVWQFAVKKATSNSVVDKETAEPSYVEVGKFLIPRRLVLHSC
jgi:hypothetical protein